MVKILVKHIIKLFVLLKAIYMPKNDIMSKYVK